MSVLTIPVDTTEIEILVEFTRTLFSRKRGEVTENLDTAHTCY